MNFLDKLEIELQELNNKIDNLESFIDSNEFKKLNNKNQLLLFKQRNHMNQYRGILEERIKINKDEQSNITK